MFYNVAYEGHNAVVHAYNIASAQVQLEWCVENGVFGTEASRMYSTVFSDEDVSWDYEVENNYPDDTDEDYGYFGDELV